MAIIIIIMEIIIIIIIIIMAMVIILLLDVSISDKVADLSKFSMTYFDITTMHAS